MTGMQSTSLLEKTMKTVGTADWKHIAVSTAIAWLCYVVGLAIYRLYLSPLAKFPGPKFAALTQWYEIYYDVFHRGGGQFTFEIKRMHEKYGPIVRINPKELHVDDPDYYEVIYATNKLYDKDPFWSYRFDMPLSSFATADSEKHRQRRAAIAPFFSRNRIRGQNDLIQRVADRISHRLANEYAGTGKVIDLLHMWGSMTSDVIMEVVFARPKHYTQAKDFQSAFTSALTNLVFTGHIMTHFGFILTFMNTLPKRLVKILAPAMRPVIEFREEMERQIVDVLAGRNVEAKTASHATLFNDILHGNLPPEELTVERLHDEAMAVVGAGLETTKWALSIGCFHILDNPGVEKRLRDELKAAMPDPQQILPWTELEKLPYFHAVVQETLRLAYGTVQRLPRINRHSAWQYGKYTIPPGTPVGMDTYHMHTNEDIFPEHHIFRPERWLGDPKGPDGVKPLSHYMVSFSRGSRMCAGINMAYAELYIGLATVFRRHRFELYETDRSDVDFAIDMVTMQPKRDTKGVRVKVLE